MDEDEEKLTAYHEAGHVVMALAGGGIIVHASLEPPDDDGPSRYGELITRWPILDPAEIAIRDLRVSLGGPVAEMIYSGDIRSVDELLQWRADSDRARLLAQSLAGTPADAQRLLLKSEQEIHDWMSSDQTWAAVCATADLLLAHQTIEHEQCLETVGFWLRRSN